MAEPEDVVAEAALIATRVARDLWSRRTAGAREGPPSLRDFRRRLELFLAAVFPEAIEIGVAEPPAPPSLLTRLARRHATHLYSRVALASAHHRRILLPVVLEGVDRPQLLDRYRLLALEQAVRVTRGSWSVAPQSDPLLRDLFLLSEAASADAWLAGVFPRLSGQIQQARLEAIRDRPRVKRESPREAAAEALLRALLGANPREPPLPLLVRESSRDSLRWAEQCRNEWSELAGPYRGLAPVPLWGEIQADPEARSKAAGEAEMERLSFGRSRTLPRRPKVRQSRPDEDDAEPGTWMIRADDLQEKAEDPAGLQRPADRDHQADPGELADALSELPELRLVRTPDPAAEVLVGEEPIARTPSAPAPIESVGLVYPEWDWRSGTYRARGAVVRERIASPGPDGWVQRELQRHGSTIRAVRRDFDRLRPRRVAIRRQRDGAEVDLEAMVDGLVDRRMGRSGDQRLYVESRPARRDAAIVLLGDVSASTDGWVTGDRRIVDVEKEALLIVSEALAALGDPHAILAFASAGPSRVSVQVLRQFGESAGPAAVRARIAGLEPGGFTRLGAAVRHATAGLGRQTARHRLLLILSDGRPNDMDEYEGRYGIEDTRTAVAEARLQGVHVFCLTVDRQAPQYASRVFGRDYAVLSRAERLPLVLTTLLRHLLRS